MLHRFMSDALLHKYGVKLENVFDTQVRVQVTSNRITIYLIFIIRWAHLSLI